MDTLSSPLHKRIGTHSKNLVYTSAGDNANTGCWLSAERNFDLWITYYGDRTDTPHRDLADIYNIRKGSKYPNLHYAYCKWRELLDNYEAVMVMDDDIILDTAGINRLFEIRKQFGLWLLQPAFSPAGRICHSITCVRPFTKLRFTNFVEMNCPLFLKSKLDEFMEVYDPVVQMYGIDWWYLDRFGPDLSGKTAIIDAVLCVNPHTRTKQSRERECTKNESLCRDIEQWKKVKKSKKIMIDEQDYRTFGSIKKIQLRDLWILILHAFWMFKRAVRNAGG